MLRFVNLTSVEAMGNSEIPKENEQFQKRRKQSEKRELVFGTDTWYLVTQHNPKEDYIHGVPVPEFCRISGPNIPTGLGIVPVGSMLAWAPPL